MAHNPHRKNNDPPRQTTGGPPHNTGPQAPQLKEWCKTKETHEQLAVGKKTSRSFAQTLGFLEEMEKRIDGDDAYAENT